MPGDIIAVTVGDFICHRTVILRMYGKATQHHVWIVLGSVPAEGIGQNHWLLEGQTLFLFARLYMMVYGTPTAPFRYE